MFDICFLIHPEAFFKSKQIINPNKFSGPGSKGPGPESVEFLAQIHGLKGALKQISRLFSHSKMAFSTPLLKPLFATLNLKNSFFSLPLAGIREQSLWTALYSCRKLQLRASHGPFRRNEKSRLFWDYIDGRMLWYFCSTVNLNLSQFQGLSMMRITPINCVNTSIETSAGNWSPFSTKT